MPIPLGGIAIKRNLDHSIQTKINQFIQESIRSSRKRYPTLSEFVVSHAQEMSEDVMRQHIDLYVNDYSIDLGEKGKIAVQKMADTIGNHSELPLFI
jgi:1,4-dihydroxy-6-naphthoate synthase